MVARAHAVTQLQSSLASRDHGTNFSALASHRLLVIADRHFRTRRWVAALRFYERCAALQPLGVRGRRMASAAALCRLKAQAEQRWISDPDLCSSGLVDAKAVRRMLQAPLPDCFLYRLDHQACVELEQRSQLRLKELVDLWLQLPWCLRLGHEVFSAVCEHLEPVSILQAAVDSSRRGVLTPALILAAYQGPMGYQTLKLFLDPVGLTPMPWLGRTHQEHSLLLRQGNSLCAAADGVWVQ
jgi:hypothetical protein